MKQSKGKSNLERHLVPCPHCGKEVLDHMTECPHCHGELTPAYYDSRKFSDPRKSRLRTILLAITVVVVVALVLWGSLNG